MNIEGVILTPLKRIYHPQGDVLHCMKKSDPGFVGFGEAYFSTIKSGEVKGWKKHKMMTLNITVPTGKVTFVIYDDRKKSSSMGQFAEIEISVDNYQRMTVAPGLWHAFKGKSKETSLILNIADMVHDPNEIARHELDQIQYNWDRV